MLAYAASPRPLRPPPVPPDGRVISPRHASVQRLLMVLGTLGRPHDQQFRTPDLDAGRALLAASSVFLLLVLASASGHSGLGAIVLALLLLAGVLVFQTVVGRLHQYVWTDRHLRFDQHVTPHRQPRHFADLRT